jgi:hypothetical protein
LVLLETLVVPLEMMIVMTVSLWDRPRNNRFKSHCEAPLGAHRVRPKGRPFAGPMAGSAIQSPRMDSAPAYAGVRGAKSAARMTFEPKSGSWRDATIA